MKRLTKQKVLSMLLALAMLLEMVPLTAVHSHAVTGGDHTDLSIDFDYVSEFEDAEDALYHYADDKVSIVEIEAEDVFPEDSEHTWVKIFDGDLKVSGGRFREAMESSAANEKFIVLSQDVELRIKKEEWEPIIVTSDKVLDLNGYELTWWDMTNKDPKSDGQSTEPTDHYENKYFIQIKEGGSLTIIDSSAPVNGYDTGKGTGKITSGAHMIDPYDDQIDHYTTRDLFVVDGNLIIYGGTFQAGRQKDQYKSNFSWDKLFDCIGNTLSLGISIAEYATGITGAEAVLDDIKKENVQQAPAQPNTSDSNDAATDSASSKPTGEGGKQNETVQTPASAGGDKSKDRAQTVKERKDTDTASNGTSGNTTGGSAAQTGGNNESNAQGTAKKDENAKIAAAEKEIVNAALDKDKVMDIFDKTATVVSDIAGMFGVQEGSRVTQTIHGTVAKVKRTGTLVVYGGTLQGHGSSEHTRNATIEVIRVEPNNESGVKRIDENAGRVYIYGGIIEGYAGANCFNTVKANAKVKVMRPKPYGAWMFTETSSQGTEFITLTDELAAKYKLERFEEYEVPISESNGLEVLHYENQANVIGAQNVDDVTAIPIDTSNVTVRGGTFRCYYEFSNVSVRIPEQIAEDQNGDIWQFTQTIGTSGSVNLGLESFGEDMIRDGRIQLNDVYGDGSLVLMDETVDEAHPAGLKHYRLYCGDTELRHIRYLDVYPMNAGANSTHSFALQTYYGDNNLHNISTWNTENDDENLHTAPFAGDEFFFDYEYDGIDANDIYVMPNLDGGVYGENMSSSDAWYYPDPVDHNGNVIGDFSYSLPFVGFWYMGSDDVFAEDNCNAPVHYMKDLHIFEGGDDDYSDYYNAHYEMATFEEWRQNLKWFRYRIYRVDPITRENIQEPMVRTSVDDGYVWGEDSPLAEVVYGVAEDQAMRCKLNLEDLEKQIIEKTKGTANEWTGYKPGEMYRIVFNVDEHLRYGYTSDARPITERSEYTMAFKYESQTGNDWSIRNVYERQVEEYAGIMPVASTESSVMFRCSSAAEKSEITDATEESHVFFETDYTPLQFDKFAIMAGEEATINFRNAKVSQLDAAASDFIDVYYQWYISDDNIIDRNDDDKNIIEDELLAGTTNVCLDASIKHNHKPSNWDPDADIYEYRNSLSPDDPNYEAYGEDGLPEDVNGWTMYDLHAYTTELRQNILCTIDPDQNPSMQNNNPFAFNTDSCYIPEDAAGKYLYVRAIVTNLTEEYTKVYDKKQVFYSHPMLIIDSSMLHAENQEPVMDLGNISNIDGAFVSKTINATLGQDMMAGFSGIEFDSIMHKQGFRKRLSQKLHNSSTSEVLYEADNGETINLKDYITEPGNYYLEQSQEIYYIRPYWDYDVNQYEKTLYTNEFVASRIDRFPITVDLPLPDEVDLEYARTGFAVGEEITITATVEPEGDYWYKWMLDDADYMEDMTVLQDSQSNVLKYTFEDETPQRFWLHVYAKDGEGNSSINVIKKITSDIAPGDQMVATTYVNDKEIQSDNGYSATLYLEQYSDSEMKVEVEGGRGEYSYRAYKRLEGQFYDTAIGTSNTIVIDTSEVGKTDYVIYAYDEFNNQTESLRLYVYIVEPLNITSARETTTTINRPTEVNLWAKYNGYDVSRELFEKVNGTWKPVTNAEFGSNGDCYVYVGTNGTHEYRLILNDYFGNQQNVYFTVIYDNSEAYPVVARGEGNLLFRAKGDSEYGITFSEGEDVEMFYNGGINLDPGSDVYTDIRQEIKETYGQEIAPEYDTVEINFKLRRYDDPWKASLGGSGVDVYKEAGFDIWLGYIYDSYTYDTPSKMPEAPVSHIDGTYMTPGYYYAEWEVVIACEEPEGENKFYMSGLFEIVASGEEHVHNYAYKSGKIDNYTHYLECLCGHRIEEEHDFRNDVEDHNALNIPWSVDRSYVEDSETGELYLRKSGTEYRICYDPTGECKCYYTQYRWAFVEGLTLDNEVLELGMNGSAKVDYSIDFMEEFDAIWLEQNPNSSILKKVDEFIPPNNAVIWASSDESVATVDADGNITAVGAGTAEITCTTVQPMYEGGQITETCTVTVECDHTAANLIPASESTCSVAGCVEHYTCSECGQLSITGDFTDTVTEDDVYLSLANHTASNVWGSDESGHFRTCKYGCGTKIGGTISHTYNVDAATCTTSKYCKTCKYVAEEQLAHSIVESPRMEPTCTTTGTEAYYSCTSCKAFYMDSDCTVETTYEKLTIRALGHAWAEATCTSAKTCTREDCGETEGTALGHNMMAANCFSPATCSTCGHTEGSALGHTWVEATCTSAKTCSVCLETEGDKLAHTVTDEATCTTDGVCDVCNNVITEAFGHTFTDGVCTVCGEAEMADITVELGSTSETVTYTVEGNNVTVKNDLACKLGYLDGDKYVAVTATANADGSYSYEVPDGVTDVVLVLSGDINGDGKINSGDKAYLNAILLGKVTPDAMDSFVADMNNNGGLASNDKAMLNAALLGKTSIAW